LKQVVGGCLSNNLSQALSREVSKERDILVTPKVTPNCGRRFRSPVAREWFAISVRTNKGNRKHDRAGQTKGKRCPPSGALAGERGNGA
jgi:hypothetical protein